MATPQINGSSALKSKEYRVITIPAREQRQEVKLRVAAYARVSSSSEDQLNSFAAQNRYYTDLIAGKENWQQVDIYADEGITGTSAEKRDDFQRLLTDCRRGLIDRVLVKSISRFARNTKECLETIRELKLLGVSIYFEKEHIDTATMSGEMMTALFAAFAQAESESISGNMRWGIQARMQSGAFLPSHQPFGYILVDHKITIDVPRARFVCMIFSDYLSGMSTWAIANKLNRLKSMYPELQGRTWTHKAISRILRNEKYIGDSLWQKTYRTDTLPTKQYPNRGEQAQYYAHNTHPAIIDRDIFQKVQALMASRRIVRAKADAEALPHIKIVCNKCGNVLRRKTVNGKVYRICRTHDTDPSICGLPPISEVSIHYAFLRLYYKLKHHGSSIFDEMLSSLQTIRSRRMLWSEDIISLNNQISDISSQNQLLAQLNQHGLVDPDIFIYQSNELAELLRDAKLKKERLLNRDGDMTIDQTQEIMAILDAGPEFLETFDENLFDGLVDKIIVESNEQIRFRLKNGLELVEPIERTVR